MMASSFLRAEDY